MSAKIEERLKESYADIVGLQLLTIYLPESYEAYIITSNIQILWICIVSRYGVRVHRHLNIPNQCHFKLHRSIVDTQVQVQRQETRHKEQASAQIEAETKVIESEYAKNVTVILAEGKANYFKETQLAQATALQNRVEAENTALGHVKESLGKLAEGTHLNQYQQMLAFSLMSNATFLYGVDKALPVINIASNSATGSDPSSMPSSSDDLMNNDAAFQLDTGRGSRMLSSESMGGETTRVKYDEL